MLVEQRVPEFVLFALLVGGDNALAAGVGELDRPALTLPEVAGADLLAVDQGDTARPSASQGRNSSFRSSASEGRFGRSTWRKPTKGSNPMLVRAAMQSWRTRA